MSKIIGVGTDIVEVGRVLKSCEKHSFLINIIQRQKENL